jgi:phage tail tape-measure protein
VLIKEVKKMKYLGLLLVLSLVLVGCTTTQKGAGVGSVIGAGVGAIIGHQSGHAVEGAVIGGAAGGLGGAMVGEQMANKFCPVCGADYPGDVQYCPKDGTELKAKQ